MILSNLYQLLDPNWSQNEKCSEFIEIWPNWYFKFGTFDMLNMLISILMSKIILIKYLPPVRPKLVPKLKVLRIYWNLAYSTFKIWQPRFWCQKWFKKYLPSVRHKLVAKLKMLRIYSNLAHLMLRISRSRFLC